MFDLQVAIVREKNRNDSISYKLGGIEKAAVALRDAQVGLIVAPEYYFRNWWAGGVKEYHVTKSEKDDIKSWLSGLSRNYPNIIIAPGTIAWKEPAKHRTDLLNDISSIGPTYFSSTNNSQIGAFGKFQQVSKSSVSGVLYNTAYLFHDGDWCGIDKQGDFQESSSGNVLVYEKGTLVRRFRVNGRDVTLGLEICLDHAMGRLRDYLTTNSLGEVDVHVLMSDFVVNTPSNFCARSGGAVVHASTVDRNLVDSGRYEYRNMGLGGGWQIWDHKKNIYRTDKTTVYPKTGATATLRALTFPTSPPISFPYQAFQAQHHQRITNVFKRTTLGGYVSQRVSHESGYFFKICTVRIE